MKAASYKVGELEVDIMASKFLEPTGMSQEVDVEVALSGKMRLKKSAALEPNVVDILRGRQYDFDTEMNKETLKCLAEEVIYNSCNMLFMSRPMPDENSRTVYLLEFEKKLREGLTATTGIQFYVDYENKIWQKESER